VLINIYQYLSNIFFNFGIIRKGFTKKCKMEDFEKNEDRMENDANFRDEIYSVSVRAGKRTYFFDVKSTRRDEFYLTITESKKRFEQDGNFHFEKHKIFLYKEDFEKFVEGLQEVITFIEQNQIDDYSNENEQNEFVASNEKVLEEVGYEKDYTKLEFDDLSS